MRGKLFDIVGATENQGIPIREEVQRIQERWVGKAKGLIYVMYKRRFFDHKDINTMKK